MRQIVKPTNHIHSETAVTKKEITVRRVVVEWQDVVDLCRNAVDEFYRDRRQVPGFLLLGWKTWMRLGWRPDNAPAQQPSRFEPMSPAPTFPKSFEGVTIVVDESEPDGARALPATNPWHLRVLQEGPDE